MSVEVLISTNSTILTLTIIIKQDSIKTQEVFSLLVENMYLANPSGLIFSELKRDLWMQLKVPTGYS